MMAEEPQTESEGATATVEPTEEPAESGSESEEVPPGKPSIRIERDALSAEARKDAEEAAGKPLEDVAYEVASEESLPGAVTSLKIEVAADAAKIELVGAFRQPQ